MRLVFYIATGLASLVPVQASADEIMGELGGWKTFQAGDACGMTLQLEEPGATKFTFTTNIDWTVTATVTNINWTAEIGETYQVTYYLNGSSYSNSALGTVSDAGTGYVSKVRFSFSEDIAKASTLDIYLNTTKIGQLPMDGADNAMAAVRRCLSIVRNGPAAMAAIPPKPLHQEKWAKKSNKGIQRKLS